MLGVTGAVWREIGIVDDLSTAYSLNKGISLAPRWQISEKILLEMQAKYEQRDFTQSLAATSAPVNARKDSLRTVALALSYKPLRNTILQTSVFHTEKSSSLQFDSYSRNGVSISVQQQL
jgi:hypothetical protein